jgi:hypothetical protein
MIYIMQEESISVINTPVEDTRTESPVHPLGMQCAYILLLCFVAPGLVGFMVYAIQHVGDKPYTFTTTGFDHTETPTPLVAQHRYT